MKAHQILDSKWESISSEKAFDLNFNSIPDSDLTLTLDEKKKFLIGRSEDDLAAFLGGFGSKYIDFENRVEVELKLKKKSTVQLKQSLLSSRISDFEKSIIKSIIKLRESSISKEEQVQEVVEVSGELQPSKITSDSELSTESDLSKSDVPLETIELKVKKESKQKEEKNQKEPKVKKDSVSKISVVNVNVKVGTIVKFKSPSNAKINPNVELSGVVKNIKFDNKLQKEFLEIFVENVRYHKLTSSVTIF